jgi:spermidine/putrescine transport system permease protein
MKRLASWWRNPSRPPIVLASFAWLYVLWSIVPVLIAIRFSFNSGRSRSTGQGFSFRWWWGDPTRSLWHDEALRDAMVNSVVIAGLTMLIATPLGVGLALGLTRWRGRVGRGANLLMLLPLSAPEIVLGAMLFLVFDGLYTAVPLGRPAMVLGHVTFAVSYVVVVVRSRLLTIPPDLEEAAEDLGATPRQALRTVVLPLLGPAIFASLMIVFATSIDNFVISSFLSADVSSETVPIKLYSSARGSPTPAINALGAAMLAGTTVAIGLAIGALRVFRRGQRGSAVEDLARLEV